MRKRKNKDEESAGGGEGGWLVTFSDLCTLLLTFFVLLLSMSSMNQRAFRMTFHNFNASSGVLYFNRHDRVILPQDMAVQDLCKSLASVYVLDIRDLNETSQENVVADENYNLLVSSGNAVYVKKDKLTGTFSFIFGDKLLFESGTATLNPHALPLLRKMADFLLESKYYALIDGHTDNVPIHSGKFSSNEELSLARSLVVLDFFVTQCGVDSKRLAMGGYGSSHPMADNATAAGRETNRRVEIIFRKTL